MSFLYAIGNAFLEYRCECCGRLFGGAPQYREGLRQCAPCASGEHRHARRQAA